MKETAISERHRFHQKHFLIISLIFLSAGVVAIGLVFLIRIQVVTAGIVFGIFVVTYLLVNSYLKYFKEVAGSLLYTGGVILPAWTLNTQPLIKEQFLLISIFTLIVFTNMLIFARFSIEEDQLNKQKSLATALGVRFMNNLIRIVMLICFLVMIYSATDGISPELILFLVMEGILMMVFEVKYFRINDRYRFYGDAIFLLPVLLLIALPLPAAASLSLP